MRRLILNIFVALYLFGFKLHRKTGKWLFSWEYGRIISEAFWMSVLPKSFIAALDEYHYSHSEKYCTETYNHMGFFKWESDMIDRYFANCTSLMVLGSGGGREMLALQKKGYEVEGYECNEKLLDFSKNFLLNSGTMASVFYAKPNHGPDNDKVYDGIILGWGAYNHVMGKERRINLLKEINTHLTIGSPFMINFWFAYENIDHYSQKLWKVNRFFCRIFRTHSIEKGDLLTEFSGHIFSMQEVSDELLQAGFIVNYANTHPYGHMVAHKTCD
ncbi:MAG: hypothetical protein WCL06_00260 [Bacteroidota bacterium]